MPDVNEEYLQAQSRTDHARDFNGGFRVATGLNLDANGIARYLFNAELHGVEQSVLLQVLRGGLLLDGTTNAYAETADDATLDILGDIDIRVEYTATGSLLSGQNLVAKWTPAAQQSYRMLLVPLLGQVQLITSSTGANSVANALANPATTRVAALRCTLDVDNGAAGRTARFYSAASLAGPWVEAPGSPVITAVVTSIFNSTAVLRLGTLGNGTEGFIGVIHRVEVRTGIDGTVVANPDFRSLAPGTTSFSDAAGRSWTLGSAARIV